MSRSSPGRPSCFLFYCRQRAALIPSSLLVFWSRGFPQAGHGVNASNLIQNKLHPSQYGSCALVIVDWWARPKQQTLLNVNSNKAAKKKLAERKKQEMLKETCKLVTQAKQKKKPPIFMTKFQHLNAERKRAVEDNVLTFSCLCKQERLLSNQWRPFLWKPTDLTGQREGSSELEDPWDWLR